MQAQADAGMVVSIIAYIIIFYSLYSLVILAIYNLLTKLIILLLSYTYQFYRNNFRRNLYVIKQ